AVNLNGQHRYPEAEALLVRALGIYDKAAYSDAQRDVTATLDNLVRALRDQGKNDDAEPHLQRLIDILTRTAKRIDPTRVREMTRLAGYLESQNRRMDAEPLLRKVLEIQERNVGPDHPEFATILEKLSMNIVNQSRHAEEEALDRRALAIRESVH